MQNNEMISVQVCYSDGAGVILLEVRVPLGSTLLHAIEYSGILKQLPEINLATQKVGVFGKLKSLDSHLHPNDRIEIYRPLLADPMEARRRRAVKNGR
ncbi:RnfH family protein [Undibacterium sp. Dicai25W]|uniref:RnfH family protein n=1 Tax=Undibacterium sp. Dicai25W TaxID=3413034 RepID=UPI003BF2797F